MAHTHARVSGFVAASLLLTLSTAAASPPEQLRNKSIKINWSEFNVNKRVSDGFISRGEPKAEYVIYVGSDGQVSLTTMWSTRTNQTKHRSTPPPNDIIFEGSELIVQTGSIDTARRMTVTFDQSFANCTAALFVGKATVAPKMIGVDGKLRELISVTVGPVSCSIKEGDLWSD